MALDREYQIEEILDELNADGLMVLILKANGGYSAVFCNKAHYGREYLQQEHYNGATVLEALNNLIEEKRKEE